MKFFHYIAADTPPALRMATPIHPTSQRGYAYSNGTHHIALYGAHQGLWTIHEGLTVTEGVIGPLESWIAGKFAAIQPVAPSLTEVGHSVAHVWRPGIYTYADQQTALGATEIERREAMQALRLQLERLDEILLYIEPTAQSLNTYGHKARDLLILACTEVENCWKAYMTEAGATPQGRDFTTTDYVKLNSLLHLADYQINLKGFRYRPTSRPFATWSAAQPTQSLLWYHAYNQTKHDRQQHFDKGTLGHCISAVAANIALFCARFSPYPLYNEGTTVSVLFNHMFEIELVNPNPATFYLPLIEFPANPNLSLTLFNIEASGLKRPWTMKPFRLP